MRLHTMLKPTLDIKQCQDKYTKFIIYLGINILIYTINEMFFLYL